MKVELLAPAGDLEKLKYALHYGADAVYMAGKSFGLRSSAGNFTLEEMKEAIDYTHERGKRIYLVINILAHNQDLEPLRQYLNEIKGLAFDAYIVADPGILMMAREILGPVEFHLSTQASATNIASAKFWAQAGVRRIVLARELSLEEIREMIQKAPEVDYEVFIHGAMCMSYSGRCLISNYMSGRDANHGDCAQSCRWNYSLIERKRPGEAYPIEEDERGTYFFNSKDLCTLEILDQIVETGVASLKVEGRNKSFFYVASVMRFYREALRRISEGEPVGEDLFEEATKVSHRDYTLGFYQGRPDQRAQVYTTSSYLRDYDFIGVVLGYDEKRKWVKIEQRNKFSLGETIELIGPDYRQIELRIEKLYNEEGEAIESAPHAKQIVYLPCDQQVFPMDLLRRKH